jgi:hypothetical protein
MHSIYAKAVDLIKCSVTKFLEIFRFFKRLFNDAANKYKHFKKWKLKKKLFLKPISDCYQRLLTLTKYFHKLKRKL